jgi:hypothetical protein
MPVWVHSHPPTPPIPKQSRRFLTVICQPHVDKAHRHLRKTVHLLASSSRLTGCARAPALSHRLEDGLSYTQNRESRSFLGFGPCRQYRGQNRCITDTGIEGRPQPQQRSPKEVHVSVVLFFFQIWLLYDLTAR